mgnify:CR=1 FL=1
MHNASQRKRRNGQSRDALQSSDCGERKTRGCALPDSKDAQHSCFAIEKQCGRVEKPASRWRCQEHSPIGDKYLNRYRHVRHRRLFHW